MDGFVAREKVADMTCSTQVKSGGKRGRPIKHSMCLYRQSTYIKLCIIVLLCLCTNCDANNTHAHTCTYVMAGDQSCNDHFKHQAKHPHMDPVFADMDV